MDNLRRLQLAEKEILRSVTEFCSEHGLRYVVMGGTLLGAVRHGGFIPWDDDVDIAMPRSDYERFLTLAKSRYNGIDTPFNVLNYKEDVDHIYYFTRVVDKRVTLIDKSSVKEKTQFAWIDVFPLDGMPKNALARALHKISLLHARLMFQYSRFDDIVSVKTQKRPLHEKLLIAIGKIFNVQKIISNKKALMRLDKRLKKYPFELSEYAVNFMGAGKFKEMHKRSLYEDVVSYKFEDLTVNGVRNSHEWLTAMYGDYMTLPNEKDRNKHFTSDIKVCDE